MNIPKFLRLCLLLFGLLAIEQKALATHLFGGEVKYQYLDANGTNPARPYRYKVTYYVYYNCGSGAAAKNQTIAVRFYSKSTSGGASTEISSTLSGPTQPWTFNLSQNFPTISPPLPPGCTISISQCVQLLTYERIVELPPAIAGYYTLFTLGARNNGIDNLANSGGENLTLYADMGPTFRFNNSPVFTDTAVAIMCAGDTATIINNATDPDGDRLIYSFSAPAGNVNTTNFTLPPTPVQYASNFSVTQPFGPGGYAFLNATSGLTKYFIPNPGEYVVSFQVKEYRTINGVEQLVGTSVRDVQIFVSNLCGSNNAPKLKIPASSYTVKPGSSLTIKVRGTDADSLTQPLTYSGEIFAPSGAKIADIAKITQTGQSIVSTINFTAPCSQPGVYTINLKLKDQACPISKSDPKTILITVPPFKGPAINGDSIVCNTGRNKYFVTRGSGSDVSAVNWSIASGAGTITPGVTTDTVYVQWSGTGSGSLRSKYTSTFGCQDSTFRTVTISPGLTPSFTGLAANYCLSDGSVTLVPNISGGTFSGSGVSASGVFTPSAASVGTHTITYTVTNNACKSTATASVTVSATPTPNFGNLTQSSYCKGAAAITAPANSSFSINGGAPTQTFDPNTLVVGNYTVVVTTTSGNCSASASKAVSIYAVPGPSLAFLPNAFCRNDAAVSLPAGTNVTYKIDNGTPFASGSFNPAGLSVGTHTVEITENNGGCIGMTTKTVTVNATPTPSLAFLNSSYCKDASAVTFPAAATGNSVEYKIDGTVATSFNPQTLAAGTYTVSALETITATGCNVTTSKSVTVNAIPTPSLAFLNTSYCKDAAAVTLPAGSGGVITKYTVNGVKQVAGSTFNPQALAAGTYTIVAIDSISGTGCKASTTKTVTINAVPNPNLNFLANSYCKDAAAISFPAAVTGNAIEYKIDGVVASSFNPQTLAAGTYTISVLETVTATGCAKTTSKQVTVNALPTPSLAIVANAYCKNAAPVTLPGNGGGIIKTYTVNGVKVTGGTGYTIDPAVLPPGTYTLTLTDSVSATGCKASVTKTVTINALPAANLAFLNSAYCKDAAVISFPAAVTGNTIEYKVNGTVATSFDPQTLAPGTYTVSAVETITATTCSATTSKTVTVNALPTPTLAFLNTSYCKDAAAITLPAGSGGVFTRYTVNGVKQAAGTTFNPQTLVAGSYTVVAIDSISATGCKASTSKTVIINAVPTPDFATLADAYCKSSAAVSLAIAGSDYYIDGSSTKALTFNPAALSAGNHTVLVTTTNAAGCTATATKTIAILEAVPNFGGLTASAYCKDATAITAPAGNAYSINGGAPTTVFDPATLTPGTYTVSVTATVSNSTISCTTTANKTVTINAVPTPSLVILANSYCKDAAAITFPAAAAGNTIEYKVNGVVATSFNPQTLAPGTYTVSALETITATTCSATTSKTVTVNALPTPTLAFLNSSYCKDAAAITFPAAVTGNTIEYKVNGAVATSFDPQTLAAGTYTVSAFETITATGCNASTTKTVTINALPNPSLAILANSYCKDAAAITFPAAAAGNTIEYKIDGVVAFNFNPASLAVGTRTITALETVTATGCTKLVTKTVIINATPTPSLAFLNNSYCKDAATITFPAAVTGNTIEYKVNGTVATSFNPQTLAAGTYTISALETITATGCNATTSKTVTVNALPAPTLAFLNTSYCKDAATVTLPAGSGGNVITYQIDGVAVTNGTFNPATLAVGPRTITALETIPGTGCNATVTKTVTINPTPLADPVSGPVSVCPGITGIPYKIVNPREAIYEWTISGGSGTIVSGQNTDKIIVNWGSTPTTATITARAKNVEGCFGPTTSYNVTINPILITPQPIGNLSVCLKQGDSVRYVMPTPTPGSSFAWTINGGSMVGFNTAIKDTVYIKWTTPGAGTITVQESSVGAVNCFGNSTPLTITVLASPDATLPINGPLSVCEGTQNVAYTLNGGQNSTYAWTLTQNGNTTTLGSTSNSVSVNFGTPGQYLFTAIETNAAACVGTPITKTVTVTPKPLTDSIYGSVNICPENLANHWYSVKGPAGATYSWQVTGGTFIPTNNDSILVTFDNTLVKQITVTPTSAAGCVGASYTRTITYDPLQLLLTTITTDPVDDKVLVINFIVNKNSTNTNPIDIYRREIPNTTFTKVGTVANSAKSYTDTNVDTHNKIYEYKIESYNQCGTLIESSKHVAVLLAKATANEGAKTVTLTWNPYQGWGTGGVKEYQVYGKADNGTFQYLYTVFGTDSTVVLQNIAGMGFNQCFRIKAIGNDGQISWSNSTCTSFENKLVIYNIITPNGDEYNESFIIENIALYPGNELTIFNRWGNQVYSKKDYKNEWKGEGL